MYIRPKTCFTYLGWSYFVVTRSQKQVSKTSIFELPKAKNCISTFWAGPFTRPLLVETIISRLWHGF